ncbi:MAG: LamG domain-containing protein [Phycisphaerae bacterium]|nr:LamG domain-containing protein [Phycisphaerae bacterium]
MCRRSICLISSVLVLGLVSTVSAGLIAHWEFDEGSGTIARDSSGKGHDGTLLGDPQWVTGMIGSGALSFDGTDGLVEAGDDASLSLTDALTITAWVWVHDLNTFYFLLCKQPSGTAGDNYPGNYEFRTEANTGALQFGHQEAEGEQFTFYTSDSSIAVEQWHHVAVTVTKGDLVEFYIDGVAAGSSEQSTNFGVLNDEPVRIGGRKDGYSFFNGLLDDIRLYNRALSATQIQKLFEGIPPMFTIAEKPDPQDGALYEDTWVNLSWSPGDFAVSHDVYLGDNFDDVSDGTPGAPAFRGNQTGTFLVAGFPGFPYPDGLVPGTTYYWRIDEVNDTEPNSPWKGDVWSFSIPPKTAYSPDPADGAEFVDPNAILSWTPGYGARIHTVYFGDNFDDVSNATGGTPIGTASYSPAALESEKVYYWRVDEFDAVETHKGDIWAFTTPGAVGNPQPANGAVDVQINATLSWTAAETAASHELYFGTDPDAVKNATTASPEYVGPRALGAESYDPGRLAWDGSHAWRVDEVYPDKTVKGLVWTFATADFILVDDFESYNDIDPPDPASNRVFDKWIDGFGTTTNGALVGNDLPPYAEKTIVHGGAQSMPYLYDNNLKTSEASLTLVYPRDWTAVGVTKLSLWFRGGSTNSAERMFIALNGTAVVYHDDASATQVAKWTEWVIDLQEFAGVNLSNVNTITIGLGTKGSPAAGGTGTMYFDDIRLYR